MNNNFSCVARVMKEPRIANANNLVICSLDLGCSSRVKKNGEWTYDNLYFRATGFGNLGAFMSKCTVGEMVYVSGSISMDEYTTKDGKMNKTLALKVYDINKISNKQESKNSSDEIKITTEDIDDLPL